VWVFIGNRRLQSTVNNYCRKQVLALTVDRKPSTVNRFARKHLQQIRPAAESCPSGHKNPSHVVSSGAHGFAALKDPMKYLLCLLLLFAAPLVAQLNYSVSGGAQAFVPLNPATANLVQNLTGAPPNNATIKPAGFLFPLETNTVHEFRARNVGVVQFAYDPGIATTFWTPSPMCARMVAPCLHPWTYTASSAVTWEFAGGVLTVEWLNVEDGAAPTGATPMTFSFQAAFDTNADTIEFRYGPAVGTPYAFAGTDYCVSVTGSTTAAGRCFMPGTLAGFVDANGRMSQWPVDQYIRFTPTGTSRSAPAAAVVVGGDQMNDNVQKEIVAGTSVAAMNMQVTVSDADGDPAALRAILVSPALVQAELESAAATVPYTLVPATGVMNTGTSHLIDLIVDGGADGLRAMRVGLWVAFAGGGGGVVITPGDLQLVEFWIDLGKATEQGVSNCLATTNGGSAWALALLVPTALLGARRRRARLTPGARACVLDKVRH